MDNQIKAHLCALGTAITWGSAYPVTKLAIAGYSTNAIGFLRCFTSMLALMAIVLLKGMGGPKKEDIPAFIAGGAFGFALYLIPFNLGLTRLTASTSSVIVATSPIFAAIFALLLFKEKIRPQAWLAMLLSFGGIVVLTCWNGVFSVNTGIFYTLIAAMNLALYSVIQRWFGKGYHPLSSVAYCYVVASVLMSFALPEAWRSLASAPFSATAACLWLGLVSGGLGYYLWSTALSIARTTSQVTNYMFVTPVFATLISFILTRELPDAPTILGGVIIISGLVLFNRLNKKEAEAEPANATAANIQAVVQAGASPAETATGGWEPAAKKGLANEDL